MIIINMYLNMILCFSVIPLEIIIETSYYQSVYPVDKHVVGSFVGRFCLERSIILPVPFEAAEVMMNVQSIERTFVDKVFAVCDYKNTEYAGQRFKTFI